MSAPSPASSSSSSSSSSPPSDIPSFESLDGETQSAYSSARGGNFAPALSLLRSGADFMHSFHLPKTAELPGGVIDATSFLRIAIWKRDVSTSKELLSFWSPEKHPDDPLLPLSVDGLLNTSDDTTASEDVELFRLLLDHGLDLNCDVSPGSPLACLGFNASLVAHIANYRNTSLMRVALEPQYNAIVDKGNDSKGTALTQAVMNGDTEMMGVLMDTGADGSFRTLGPKGFTLVAIIMDRLAYPHCHSPSQQADLAYGRGVEVLAKLLYKGKPGETQVEEALADYKHASTADGKTGLFLLQRYLDGKPFCCDLCGTTKRKDGDVTKRLDMCACKSVAYCCKQHQLDAWRAHKGTCGGALDEEGMAEAIVRKSGRKKGGGKKGGGKKGKRG